MDNHDEITYVFLPAPLYSRDDSVSPPPMESTLLTRHHPHTLPAITVSGSSQRYESSCSINYIPCLVCGRVHRVFKQFGHSLAGGLVTLLLVVWSLSCWRFGHSLAGSLVTLLLAVNVGPALTTCIISCRSVQRTLNSIGVSEVFNHIRCKHATWTSN